MAENNELERTLWQAADKMRSNMDAADYKHIVLGLIFLKYISDAFNGMHAQLAEGKGEFEGADPEDPTNIWQTMFSSCLNYHAGTIYKVAQNSQQSEKTLMTQWMRSRRSIHL
jgi:type I restriction-modification system DNA methylase subunit